MNIFRTITITSLVGAATLALFAFVPRAFSAADDSAQDVLQALGKVNEANQDVASALLATKPNRAMPRAQEGTVDLYQAYTLLAEAAQDASSPTLAADAQAMLAVYNKMTFDVAANNLTGALADSSNAQQIANKAVIDASH